MLITVPEVYCEGFRILMEHNPWDESYEALDTIVLELLRA
jgi:hypothetical protein